MLPKALSYLISTTIANGGTKTAAIDIGEGVLAGIIFPATLTGTGVTFETSWDGSTYYVPNVGGTDVTLAKQNSKLVPIKESVNQYTDYFGRYVKLVSSGAEGAERTLIVVVRPRT
jgi:hypothetical protein